MRIHSWIVAALVAAAPLPAQAQPARAREAQREARERAQEARRKAQQGSGQTENFSRTVPLGADGRVSVQNISGRIEVNTGSRREVVISAVKRTRGDRSELSRVRIEVDANNDRVDVRTVYDNDRNRRDGNSASVDYTLTVPASAALELKSISGDIRVNGVQGPVFAEAISGDITTTGTPRVEAAKTVSGDVEIADISTDRALSAETISGRVRGRNIKARELTLKTVSGEIVISDATADRVNAHSVSGSLDYAGSLSRGGTYDFNSHSGPIRLTIPESSGFRLTASTFSGNITSDLPLTIGGTRGGQGVVGGRGRGRGRRGGNGSGSIEATAGDGSANVEIHSFSSDVTISKR